MAKTTEEHYKIFVDECMRLKEEWGLNDWKLFFEHEKDEDNRAQIWTDVLNHAVVIRLSLNWHNSIPTNELVVNTARHEMIHLLFSPLHHLAGERFITPDQLKTESERLTRQLMSILFGPFQAEVLSTDTDQEATHKRREGDG
ncbi:MAG: hypothetical protein PHO27_11935 [Sulfuricurvum sp.]|jgi:hypothetical protein|nr:hypothetical protein [Sulfuricurvum sp.]